MKKKLSLVMSVIMATMMFGCSDNVVKGAPNFGNGAFGITVFSSPMGEHTYNGVKYENGITSENYKLIKDSGVDGVLGLWDDAMPAGDVDEEMFLQSNTYKALEASKANGVKYYVMDQMLRGMVRGGAVTDAKLNKIPARLEFYKNHEAFGGIHLDDEPSASKFENCEKVRAKIMESLGADGDVYVNLFGSRASATQLSGSANKAMTYDEYMALFDKKTNFSRVSYDNYPFYYKADDTNPDMVMWFENLQTATEYATKQKPINLYIQSCDMDPSRGADGIDYTDTNYYAQIRSQKDISFQLNTGLAFGVEQFTYFTYWTPNDPEIVKGMIALDGSKTPIYDFVKTSNEQIRKVEKKYLSYEYIKTIAVPKNGEELSYLTSMLKENTCSVAKIKSSEEIVVGEMKNATGHKALMIANATEPRFNLNATVELEFADKYDKAIVINDGIESIVDIIAGKLSVTVGSGGGAMVMPYLA